MLMLVVLAWLPFAPAQAPTPRALREAKSVYLVNDSGDLARFDDLANELRQGRRFEIVDAPEAADLVVIFGHTLTGDGSQIPAAAVTITSQTEALTLRITARGGGDPLWTDREVLGSFSQKGAVTNLVKRLHDRLGVARVAPATATPAVPPVDAVPPAAGTDSCTGVLVTRRTLTGAGIRSSRKSRSR